MKFSLLSTVKLLVVVIMSYVFTSFVVEGQTSSNPVPDSAQEVQPLQIGSVLPAITLRTMSDAPFDLNKAISEKPTLLIFYRGGWCPYCNEQLGQLKEIDTPLAKIGYQILAISADRPDKVKETIDKHNMHYTLLSDNDMACARALGIAFLLDDTTYKKYMGYGIPIEEHRQLPVPSIFIIGTDGVIKFEYVNPDYRVRLDPDVILAAAKSVIKQKKK